MSLFAIADLHLSFGSDKPMDIFEGWDGYVDKIRNNWAAVVKENDTVVIPGDVSWAMDLKGFRDDAGFINSLPGRKIIIKGNHDFWWTTLNKMNGFLNENGFDSISIINNNAIAVGNVCVCGTRGWFYDITGENYEKMTAREASRLEASISYAEKTGLEPVVFLHFPPVYSGFECMEIMEVLLKHKIKRCYYGHLHGKAKNKAVEGCYKNIVFRLVSCDGINFSPIIIEK